MTELVPCGVPLGACHSCVALTGAVCGQGTQNGVVRFYLPSVRRSVLAAYTKASKKRTSFFQCVSVILNMIKRPLQRGYRGYDKWPRTITGNFFFHLAV